MDCLGPAGAHPAPGSSLRIRTLPAHRRAHPPWTRPFAHCPTPRRPGATTLRGNTPCHKEFSSPALPADLGRAVVTTLHEAGFDVVAADQTYNRDLPVRTHVVDLRDPLVPLPHHRGLPGRRAPGQPPQRLRRPVAPAALRRQRGHGHERLPGRRRRRRAQTHLRQLRPGLRRRPPRRGQPHHSPASCPTSPWTAICPPAPATPTPSAKKPARPSSATSSPSTPNSPAPPCDSPPCSTPAGSNTSAADARRPPLPRPLRQPRRGLQLPDHRRRRLAWSRPSWRNKPPATTSSSRPPPTPSRRCRPPRSSRGTSPACRCACPWPRCRPWWTSPRSPQTLGWQPQETRLFVEAG